MNTRHDPVALAVGTDRAVRHRHDPLSVLRRKHISAWTADGDRHRPARCGTPPGYRLTPRYPTGEENTA
jgi:hypothetical protein